MTRKIKIVQFQFEPAIPGGDEINAPLWALGEDGALYVWTEEAPGDRGEPQWLKAHDCIEVEDDKQD